MSCKEIMNRNMVILQRNEQIEHQNRQIVNQHKQILDQQETIKADVHAIFYKKIPIVYKEGLD